MSMLVAVRKSCSDVHCQSVIRPDNSPCRVAGPELRCLSRVDWRTVVQLPSWARGTNPSTLKRKGHFALAGPELHCLSRVNLRTVVKLPSWVRDTDPTTLEREGQGAPSIWIEKGPPQGNFGAKGGPREATLRQKGAPASIL